ncbi:MAG: GNAT family N-acetyltransferase, partial [Solirubrobacteraceae bacterium]
LAAERDIPEVLIAHQDDPDLYRRLCLARPPSGAELGRRVEAGPADRAGGTALWLTIVAASGDECIGQIDVRDVDWDHSRAELGIWTAPAQRGRGVAADALRLAGGWLLAECGLARLQLVTEPDNVAMVAAARRAGFVEEGVLRGYLRERGRRVDVTMMSLVAADVVTS